MIKIIKILIIFSIIFFNLKFNVEAQSILLEDNFSNTTTTFTQWEIEDGIWGAWGNLEGNWEIENENLKSSINRPFKANVISAGKTDWDNYEITGDIFSEKGVDQSILFRMKDKNNFYGLDIRANWDDQGTEQLGNILLFKWVNGNQTLLTTDIDYEVINHTWYNFKIIVENEHFHIEFQDKEKNMPFLSFDYEDSDLKKGKIALQSWSGQYLQLYPSDTVIKRFDNIVVREIEKEKKALILIPGIGASWNAESILLNKDMPTKDWVMTPGIKIYDNLINLLELNGYKKDGENKNLFIFNYDWTKNSDYLIEELKNFIDNDINISKTQKIDIVGHSFGGLIARGYLQKHKEEKINNLLIIGSPNNGSTLAYYAWEGADLSKSFSAWQRIGISFILYLRGSLYKSNIDVIQSSIPSIKDLLPTFNYIKQNFIEKRIDEMVEKNYWLEQLNDLSIEPLMEKGNNILGNIENSTIRWINVSDNTFLEKKLGLWKDGKPINEEYSNGDDTILVESGKIPSNREIIIDGYDHTKLVFGEKSIKKIMEILDLRYIDIMETNEDVITNNFLIIQIASPAKIYLLNQENETVGFGDDKTIIVANPKNTNYRLKIVGTGSGNYNLFLGQITQKENLWEKISGQINNNQEIIYYLEFENLPSKNLIKDENNNILKNSVLSKFLEVDKSLKNSQINFIFKNKIILNLRIAKKLLNKNMFKESLKSVYKTKILLTYYLNIQKNNSFGIQENQNRLQEIADNLENLYINTNNKKNYNNSWLYKKISLNTAEKLEKCLYDNKDAAREAVNLFYLSSKKINEANNTSSLSEKNIKTISSINIANEGILICKNNFFYKCGR